MTQLLSSFCLLLSPGPVWLFEWEMSPIGSRLLTLGLLIGDAVWGDGAALMEEEHHWGWTLRVCILSQLTVQLSVSLFLLKMWLPSSCSGCHACSAYTELWGIWIPIPLFMGWVLIRWVIFQSQLLFFINWLVSFMCYSSRKKLRYSVLLTCC